MEASVALLFLGLVFCLLAAAIFYLNTSARPRVPVPEPTVEDAGRETARPSRGGAGRMRRRGRGAAESDVAGASSSAEPAANADSGEEEAEEAGGGYYTAGARGKKGAKKQEKEARREAEQAAREVKREKEDRHAEARRKRDEAREAEERKKEEEAEAARKAEEEAAQEDFKKWKDMFSTEGEGTVEQDTQEESQGLLAEFVDYIKAQKMVVLEDLAAEFSLRTQDVINRLHTLESMGRITGVMDDRGKFIYISPEEMQEMASYIKRVGRVSISHLASKSNELIDLNPKPRDDALGSSNQEVMAAA